jgi:flavin-binding protein dodecin
VKESVAMPQSVYKVIEIIGTSPKSWEEAAKNAVELTGEHLRELRVAEVMAQDLVLSADGKVEAYRTKLKVSFKYEGGH